MPVRQLDLMAPVHNSSLSTEVTSRDGKEALERQCFVYVQISISHLPCFQGLALDISRCLILKNGDKASALLL